jgi:NADH-quinone oxidoreductase subunit G
MPDRVVWLPLNSTGGGVPDDLGAGPGQVVRISAAAPPAAPLGAAGNFEAKEVRP